MKVLSQGIVASPPVLKGNGCIADKMQLKSVRFARHSEENMEEHNRLLPPVLETIGQNLDDYTFRFEDFEQTQNNQKMILHLYPTPSKRGKLPRVHFNAIVAGSSGVFGDGKPVLAFSVNYTSGGANAPNNRYDSTLYKYSAKEGRSMEDSLKVFRMWPQHKLKEGFKKLFGAKNSTFNRFEGVG